MYATYIRHNCCRDKWPCLHARQRKDQADQDDPLFRVNIVYSFFRVQSQKLLNKLNTCVQDALKMLMIILYIHPIWNLGINWVVHYRLAIKPKSVEGIQARGQTRMDIIGRDNFARKTNKDLLFVSIKVEWGSTNFFTL